MNPKKATYMIEMYAEELDTYSYISAYEKVVKGKTLLISSNDKIRLDPKVATADTFAYKIDGSIAIKRPDDIIDEIYICNTEAKEFVCEADQINDNVTLISNALLENIRINTRVNAGLCVMGTKVTDFRNISGAERLFCANSNIRVGGTPKDIERIYIIKPVQGILAFAGKKVSVYGSDSSMAQPTNSIAETSGLSVFREKLSLIQKGSKQYARF